MQKFTINDWLTIQTRKDLSLLRRSLKQEPIKYAIIIDLLLIILSSCIDNVYNGEKGAPDYLWYIISGIAALVTAVSILICLYRAHKRKIDSVMALSVNDLVDLFDNEVCYNIMTADSMCDHLQIDENGYIKELEGSQQEVQKFYFIETCYYLDKAISQLYKFNKSAEKSIFRDYDGVGVSIDRFLNICTLIKNSYTRLISASANNDEYKRLINLNIIKMYNALIAQVSMNDGFSELGKSVAQRIENCINSRLFSPNVSLRS